MALQLIQQVLKAKSGAGSLCDVASCLKAFLHKQVMSFTRDVALMRLESYDSLTNECLVKLHGAICDFVYDEKLTELHNQRRFMSMVKTYLRNILLDKQSAANLPVRKPKMPSFSLDTTLDDDLKYSTVDRRAYTQFEYASAKDLQQRLLQLCSEEEGYIIRCLVKRYTPEETAQRVGCSASRVRYLMYHKIQPRLIELVAAS